MAAITVSQATAVAYANSLKSFLASMASLRQQAKQLAIQSRSNDYPSTWAAMATAPFDVDGSVKSGSPDATPVATHPIVQPATNPLNVTSTQLVNAQAIVAAFVAFLDGTSAPTQLNRDAQIDAING